jgi:hypothetical protein
LKVNLSLHLYYRLAFNFVMKLLFSANKTQTIIDPKKHPIPKNEIATEDLRINMVERLKNTKTCTNCGKNKVY